MMVSEEIQPADEPVLEFLEDIKYSNQLGEGKKGFQLAFVFGENPYFSDKVLTKTYLLDPDDEDECLSKAIGSNIAWKEGKSTCVRMNTKTQKKKGKTRTVKVNTSTNSPPAPAPRPATHDHAHTLPQSSPSPPPVLPQSSHKPTPLTHTHPNPP